MAGISSLGAGSGLDLAGILKSLMSVEQQPLINLQRKEISYQARISALGSLKGTLSALQTAAAGLMPAPGKTAVEKYSSFSASVTNTDVASATASSGSVAGSYALEVTELAQSQRLVTGTSGIPPASPYSNAAAGIAQGTLKIELGDLSDGTYSADGTKTLEIEINASNNTLGGLRDAINAAGKDISATIITGSAGAQLVLTAKDSGTSNVMRLTGLTGFDYDPIANTGTMNQEASQGGRAAQNAEFTLNGITATSSTNTVSGVLDGVSLTLKKTNVGDPTTVSVTTDNTTGLNANLNAFIKSFNEAVTATKGLGGYNSETKEAGPLQGQAIIRSTQTQFRNLIFNTAAGSNSSIQRFADIGVSFNKDGLLTLDTAKLNKAIESDYSGVLNVVTKIGDSFNKSLEGVIGGSGTVTGLTDSLNRMVKGLDAQRTVLSQRLANIEDRYRKQFTALDTLIAGMKETSTYLTQQLASLSNINSSR